jgi:fibro-slime domain-containing protein
MKSPAKHYELDAAILSTVVAIGCCRVSQAQESDPIEYEDAPESMTVRGIVRDFRERTVEGGHADFERRPDHGFARYSGNIAPIIGPDRKPVFTGNGFKVASQWRDSEGRQICYLLYDPDRGDVAGNTSQSDTGGITSAASFNQWFNDAIGVNMSMPLELTLVRQEDGHYVFDDTLDPYYIPLGGFFPIEDQLFGNPGGNPDRNFHFTFELHIDFEYNSEGDQFFKFIGDDDVWVFVNNKLCIDLGGVHAAHDQYIDMNRLDLVDGETYTIDFFYAERHRTTANFRIETNLPVRTHGVPSVTMACD